MRYRITLKTVPYLHRGERRDEDGNLVLNSPINKTVKVIIEQDFRDNRQAVDEANMYHNTPFFGQRLVVDQVETVNEEIWP